MKTLARILQLAGLITRTLALCGIAGFGLGLFITGCRVASTLTTK